MEFEKFLYYLQIVCCLMLATIGIVAATVGVFELLDDSGAGYLNRDNLSFDQWFPLVFGFVCVFFSVKFKPKKLDI